jgi:predicted permease
MLSTIMATKDIILAEKENIDRNIETKEIEVSPFIFYNITNEKIYLIRKDNEYELSPMFKGPIRLNSGNIVFRLKN